MDILTLRIYHLLLAVEISNEGDFSGSPVVKTSPSNAGGIGQFLVRELRSHMPQGVAKRNK